MLSDDHREIFLATPAHLERLEKVLARWVLLARVHHRMVRKVREPVVRLVLVVEQNPGTLVRVLAEQIWDRETVRG